MVFHEGLPKMIVWVVKIRMRASQGICSARHCFVRGKIVPWVHGPADHLGDHRGDHPAARGQ